MYTSTPKRKAPQETLSPRKLTSGREFKNTNKNPSAMHALPSLSGRSTKKSSNNTSTSPIRKRVSQRLSLANRSTMTRATPYRTPKLTTNIKEHKIQSFSKNIAKEMADNSKKILQNTWKVCYMSSLFNFHLQNKNLRKSYESILKIKILENYAATSLIVEFSIERLPSLSGAGSPLKAVVLRISCLKISDTSDEENEYINVYKAWLIPSDKPQMKSDVDSKWYPLMLYAGQECIHSPVALWFQESFGCYVVEKGFSQSTIMWICAMWSRYLCSYKNHNADDGDIVFAYQVQPILIDMIRKMQRMKLNITVAMKQKNVKEVWRKVGKLENIDEETLILKVPALNRFHSGVEQFVSDQTKIPPTMLHLTKLRTPCIALSSNGTIKLSCSKTFPSLLGHLIEIFQETYLTNSEL